MRRKGVQKDAGNMIRWSWRNCFQPREYWKLGGKFRRLATSIVDMYKQNPCYTVLKKAIPWRMRKKMVFRLDFLHEKTFIIELLCVSGAVSFYEMFHFAIAEKKQNIAKHWKEVLRLPFYFPKVLKLFFCHTFHYWDITTPDRCSGLFLPLGTISIFFASL